MHEVTREMFFANILILITKFICVALCAFVAIKPRKSMKVKIRMYCFSTQVI